MKNTGVIKFYHRKCGDQYFIGHFPHYAFEVKIIDGKTALYTHDIEGYIWQKHNLYDGWEKYGDIDDNVPKEIPFADWLDGVIASL